MLSDHSTSPHKLINKREHFEILKFLLRQNDSEYANMKDEAGYSLLHRAVQMGHLEFVLEIIYAGGRINEFTQQKETPLWLAIKHGHYLIAEVLLAAGANKNAAARTGFPEHHTRLELENMRLKPEIVTALLFWEICYSSKKRPSLFYLIKQQLYDYFVDANGTISKEKLFLDALEEALLQLALLAKQKGADSFLQAIKEVFEDKLNKAEPIPNAIHRSTESFAELIKKSYEQNDFFSLFDLKEQGNEIRIFAFLLTEKNYSLLNFWLVSQAKDLYAFAPEMIYNPDPTQDTLMTNLIDYCHGSVGLLTHVINDGMQAGTLSPAKNILFKKLSQAGNMPTALALFKTSFMKQCGYDLSDAVITIQNDDFHVSKPPQQLPVARLLNVYINVFNLKKIQPESQHTARQDIFKIIVGYLDEKEQQTLLTFGPQILDDLFYQAVYQVSVIPKNELSRFEDLEKVMIDFLKELDEAYKLGHQGWMKCVSLLAFIIMLSLLIAEIYHFVMFPDYKSSLKDLMEKRVIPHPRNYVNCLQVYDDDTRDFSQNDYRYCDSLIRQMADLFFLHVLTIFGNILTDLSAIPIFMSIHHFFCKLKKGEPKENFACEPVANYPLLRSATEGMQRKFAEEEKADPRLPGSHLMPDIKDVETLGALEAKRKSVVGYLSHIQRIRTDLTGEHDVTLDIPYPLSSSPNHKWYSQSDCNSDLTIALLGEEKDEIKMSPISLKKTC